MEEIFARGGPVVWVLAGYSLLGLTVVVERVIRFMGAGRLPREMEARLAERGAPETLRSTLSTVRGPEANLLWAVLDAHSQGAPDLERVASRVGSTELQRLQRGFRTLSMLGNTAPLLGLFGTILGMIKAFQVIERAGGRVDADALAGGIWEAMVTTGVGLAVSLVLLLLLHLLEGLAERRARSMERCGSILLERLGAPELHPRHALGTRRQEAADAA
ncbi:MAG: MotA/TolQ/ExbB proton channel family protein [Gammaproteobacteria bacterium]|nr:MotA/TolQ/ExbB proton channel family protein [Gammaproteobacteria bacterium]NIR99251.1 MotA/TolQ/ExbB proton channel family protein [Gammaproteobacteria bacterium]NIT64872.1 MotA/TolQ/ExbB proton channel family protein [Gammaproteobacteria bacterium]NIV21822.1 MotA/TolQ/ExbB proton channel family protein [Gammaproteobacteria bacterium]NIX10891.1 MotA/TolQ/ExbB proton channel family protein [Gammaproteobacteria bacterium]